VEVSLRNAFGKKQTLFPASMFWMEDDGEGAQRKAATEAVEAKSGSKAVEEGTTDEPGKSPGLAKPAQAKAGGEGWWLHLCAMLQTSHAPHMEYIEGTSAVAFLVRY